MTIDRYLFYQKGINFMKLLYNRITPIRIQKQKQKRIRKNTAFLAVILCLLSTCHSMAAEEPVTINVMIAYDFFIPDDFELIAAHADALMWEKRQFHVQFYPALIIDRKRQMEQLEKQGITIDVSTTTEDEHLCLDLDPLLPIWEQDICEIATEEEIEHTRRNGKLYTLPSKADYVASFGIVFRKDILEKYAIDPENIQTIQDLDTLFEKLSQNEPDLIMTAPLWTHSGFLLRYHQFDAAKNCIFTIAPTAEEEIVNKYTTDEYLSWITMPYKWNQAGYFPEELPLQNLKGSELMRTGKLFSYFCACKPGIEWEENVSSGCELVSVPLMEPRVTNSSAEISSWGIMKNSNHPEESMQFLYEIYTNPELINLFLYGIENTHYVLLPNGTIDFPEGMTAENSGYYPNIGWSFPNQTLSYIWNGNDPDLWKKNEIYQNEARRDASLGFRFDDSVVAWQNNALNEIADTYAYGLETGMLDPTVYLPQMLNEMEKAGAAEVQAELKDQYETWRNTQKP